MSETMNQKQKQLVKEHLDLVPRMVRALTHSYSHLSKDEYEELTQTGYLALYHAAVKYNPAKAFAPYAKTAILSGKESLLSGFSRVDIPVRNWPQFTAFRPTMCVPGRAGQGNSWAGRPVCSQ